MFSNCTKTYKVCSEVAAFKKELELIKDGSIYIEESSSRIFESSQECWNDLKTGSGE